MGMFVAAVNWNSFQFAASTTAQRGREAGDLCHSNAGQHGPPSDAQGLVTMKHWAVPQMLTALLVIYTSLSLTGPLVYATLLYI